MIKQPKRTAQPQPPSGALTPDGPSSATTAPMMKQLVCSLRNKKQLVPKIALPLKLRHGTTLNKSLEDAVQF